MRRTLFLLVVALSMQVSCLNESRSLCIRLRQVAESDHPVPPVCFVAGRIPDTIAQSGSRIVEVSTVVFEELSSIIKRDLPVAASIKGVVPFFSVTIMENNVSVIHVIETREALISLLNQFKRVSEEDASITESGQLDDVLRLLQ